MSLKKYYFTKKRNFLFAFIIEFFNPLFILFAYFCARQRAFSKINWRLILILGNDHMGDVLYQTASLGLVKKRWPNSRVYFATSELGAEILKNNPAVDEVLVYKSQKYFYFSHLFKRIFLNHVKFDAVFCTAPVRYWPSLAFAVLMGIPNRAAYIFKGFSGLATHPVKFDGHAPLPLLLRKYYEDVSELNATNPSLKPVIFPTKADREKANLLFQRLNPYKKTTIALFITDRQGNYNWPLDSYNELIKKIKARFDALVLLLGSPSEKTQLNIFQQKFCELTALVNDELKPLELACFLEQCDLVITKDSGPRHLANAAGTPVVFFRSLSHREAEAAAYCETEIDVCPNGELIISKKQENILKNISIQKVFDSVEKILTFS
jgi:ADP-heptose:LPS heptosyltransferase